MMKILCLIKQVPARATLGIDKETGSLVRDDDNIVNPPDERALELALRVTDAEITICSMGPMSAISMLKRLASYKVAEIVLLSDRAFAGSDTHATARALSRATEHLGGFDLILTGTRAVDGETGQVGPEVAMMLGMPCVPDVIELEVESGVMTAKRRTQFEECVLTSPLPALCTVSMGAPMLRPPSLMGLRRAAKHEPLVLTCSDLMLSAETVGLAGSLTRVVKTSVATVERRGAKVIDDISEGVAAILGAITNTAGGERDER